MVIREIERRQERLKGDGRQKEETREIAGSEERGKGDGSQKEEKRHIDVSKKKVKRKQINKQQSSLRILNFHLSSSRQVIS